MVIRPLDVQELRRRFRSAQPFPHVVLDNFLEPGFAAEAALAFPDYSRASEVGHSFTAVNENRKVQVSDYSQFPAAVQRLSDALGSSRFLRDLEAITGVENLVWDNELAGGGMHQTAACGHLDVHVDFNRSSGGLFRRLNILLYLNPVWHDEWGGLLELWDREVKRRHQSLSPVLNRCVIFETSEISYHGVSAVRCPDSIARKSFAAYYYTAEPAPSYVGFDHTTRFRARPDERLKRWVLMPAVALRRAARERYWDARRRVKTMLTGAT